MIKRGSSEIVMNNWSDDLRRDPPIWVQIPVLPYQQKKVEKKYENIKNKY